MTEPTQSIEDLIRTIERKDRRFRVAQALFLAIIALAVAGVLLAQFHTISEFRHSSEQQSDTILQLQREAKESDKRAADHLACIARFFANPDRQDTVITDIDKCFIEQRAGETDNTSADNGSPPILQPQPSNNTPPAASNEPPVASQPSPSPSPQPGPPQQPPNQPDPPTERPPLEIIGIPVCVPIIDLCVR